MTRLVKKNPSSIAACPLYGISPGALVNVFRVPDDFGRRWKTRLRRNPSDAAAVARFVNHDLGAFDPAFEGWVCRQGLIFPPDSVAVDAGQIRAIPFMRAQLQEYERAQRWMIKAASHGEQSEAEQRARVVDLLQTAIESLRQR